MPFDLFSPDTDEIGWYHLPFDCLLVSDYHNYVQTCLKWSIKNKNIHRIQPMVGRNQPNDLQAWLRLLSKLFNEKPCEQNEILKLFWIRRCF